MLLKFGMRLMWPVLLYIPYIGLTTLTIDVFLKLVLTPNFGVSKKII